ncbi:hypothetical protein PO909_005274 [Leuciscus waleckii]
MLPERSGRCSVTDAAMAMNTTGAFDSLYKVGKKLASKPHGTVHEGIRKSDGTQVIIKYVKERQFDFDVGDSKPYCREATIMRMVEHSDHVVKLHDWFGMEDHDILIMEHPGVSVTLCDFIKENRGRLTEAEAKDIMQNLIAAFQHCREQGVCYEHISLRKVLIDPDTRQIKLAGFYRALAIREPSDFESKAERRVHALMRTNEVLYRALKGMVEGKRLLKLWLRRERSQLSKECLDLLQNLRDRESRIYLMNILDHDWFKETPEPEAIESEPTEGNMQFEGMDSSSAQPSTSADALSQESPQTPEEEPTPATDALEPMVDYAQPSTSADALSQESPQTAGQEPTPFTTFCLSDSCLFQPDVCDVSFASSSGNMLFEGMDSSSAQPSTSADALSQESPQTPEEEPTPATDALEPMVDYAQLWTSADALSELDPTGSVKYHYEVGKELPSVPHAIVYEGIRKSDGTQVIIKLVDKSQMNFRMMDYDPLCREAIITWMVEHSDHVVKLHDWFGVEDHDILIMEHPGVSVTLCDFIKENRGRLTEAEAKDIMQNLIAALRHCSEKDIYYEYISLSKVLINPDTRQIKLTGFNRALSINETGIGDSKSIAERRIHALMATNNGLYRALKEMVGGKGLVKLLRGNTPLVKGQFSFHLLDLLRNLRDRESGITLQNILDHDWFKETPEPEAIKSEPTEAVILPQDFIAFNNTRGDSYPGDMGMAGKPFRATHIWTNIINDLQAQVEVKRRRHNLKIYHDCFLGSEAVDVVLARIIQSKVCGDAEVPRSKAVRLCQAFMEAKVISPLGPDPAHIWYALNPDVVQIWADTMLLSGLTSNLLRGADFGKDRDDSTPVQRRLDAREETTRRPCRDDSTPVERRLDARLDAREETTRRPCRDDSTPVERRLDARLDARGETTQRPTRRPWRDDSTPDSTPVKRRLDAREETTRRPCRDDSVPVKRRLDVREETTRRPCRDDSTPVERRLDARGETT